MEIVETVALDAIRKTKDGYLVADVRTARTGIQTYTGREVDPENKHGLRDRATVKVYRPESEVFNKDSLASYAHRPITYKHPSELVDASNWKKYAVGNTGGEVARDGEFVRVPLVIMDAATIKVVEDGTRELSQGYTTKLVFDAGTTPEGEKYDAIQTELRMNHLAVVPVARGGNRLRIGDSDKGNSKMALIMVDGISVEFTTEQGAQIVQKAISDAGKAVSKLQAQIDAAASSHAAVIAAKDAELATLQAKFDDAASKVLDTAAIDARVAARADLLSLAGMIAPNVKPAGMSDAAIRKAVVVAKLGDAAVADKSEAYIDARFDILAEAAKANGNFNNIIGSPTAIVGDADKVARDARAEMLADLRAGKAA